MSDATALLLPLTNGSPFNETVPVFDRANVYVPATNVDAVPPAICSTSVPKLVLILVKAVLRLSPLPALGLVPVFI